LNSLTQGNAENFEFRTTHCPCPLQRREEEFERHSVGKLVRGCGKGPVSNRTFAATLEARNQRRQELIAQVLGRAAEGGSDGATFSQIA
jgi:hypothetical protein